MESFYGTRGEELRNTWRVDDYDSTRYTFLVDRFREVTVQVYPTPEDYTAQANVISRGSFDMPVVQRRLLYVAMAQVRPEDSELMSMEMSVGDVVRALGMNDSAGRYEEIRAAIDGLMSRVIEIDTGDGWKKFQWVSTAEYSKSSDTLKIRLHEELRPFVLKLQGKFKLIGVKDISRLQGKYSLRFFELSLSYESMAGTGGNPQGCWYVDLEFDLLRKMFQIGASEYKMTSDLRKWVVDAPIREINAAALGFQITPDYEFFRRGRRLLGVRLQCKRTKSGEPRTVNAVTKAELDDEKFKKDNWMEYEKLLKEIQAEGYLGFGQEDRLVLDEAKAITMLRELKKKKRGRPSKSEPKSP